ncbi:MAG: asparagine synthase (glutamine-hydrolyzing) [Planctomycetia bacterium]|nr:asparagine synthase (glutamine-hydrolyzing) [Planctomycetia bacterium]
MCGIAGLIGITPAAAASAAPRMLRALAHRGPDDAGIETLSVSDAETQITLIHTRLSILDLSSAGHQPMRDIGRGEYSQPNWLTFNGEIYNYRDLRRQLAAQGFPGRSECDTEVVLDAYRMWGEKSVERLNGMFAWCLADGNRKTLWLCRDRLGIKPLYLYRPSSGGLLFASEVRALLAAGPELVPPKVSRGALESFLAQGAVFGNDSIIEGIELIEPGCSLITDWSGKQLRKSRYWSFPVPEPSASTKDRDEAVTTLSGRLRESVRSHLIADVPLGLFLSGGIDSAALGTVAVESAGTDLRTLCIGFDQPKYDETETAAEVARTISTQHTSVRLSGEQVLADFSAALAAFDQPTVDGFNTFFTCRAAKASGLKVAISGLGGDELFGGYASFSDVPRAERFQSLMKATGPMRPLLAAALRAVGTRGASKAAEVLRRPATALQNYLLRRELFLPNERRELQGLPPESDPWHGMPLRFTAQLAQLTEDDDPINRISRLELHSYMSQMLLRDSDVCSMASGLELRVPLLDHRLVEAALPLPGKWKRRDPRPKPLLLDAVGRKMPQAPLKLPKKGFTFPWCPWLHGPLRSRAEKAVGNGEVWNSLQFVPSAPKQIWTRFIAGDRRISDLQILALIVLEDYVVRHAVRV